MERTETISKCDVCEREVPMSYHALQNSGWTKYKYQAEWKDGAHGGFHNREFMVCKECDRGSAAMGKLLDGIKGKDVED